MTTKSDVYSNFKYARHLMQSAKRLMQEDSITDYSEPSEIGQIANELIASAGMLAQWLEEKNTQNTKEG